MPTRLTDIWAQIHKVARFAPPLIPVCSLICLRKPLTNRDIHVLGQKGLPTCRIHTLRTLKVVEFYGNKCLDKDSLGFIRLQSNKAQISLRYPDYNIFLLRVDNPLQRKLWQ